MKNKPDRLTDLPVPGISDEDRGIWGDVVQKVKCNHDLAVELLSRMKSARDIIKGVAPAPDGKSANTIDLSKLDGLYNIVCETLEDTNLVLNNVHSLLNDIQ